MDIVSAGVVPPPSVKVWQSGHGAMDVVLIHMTGIEAATSQDHAVCHLYCTRIPMNVMM